MFACFSPAPLHEQAAMPNLSTKMKVVSVCLLALSLVIVSNAADDPSIDKLIGKLPPVETFVDPLINDPLAKQLLAALKQHNFGIAMETSRRLASKYPKSVAAQFVHAQMAKE